MNAPQAQAPSSRTMRTTVAGLPIERPRVSVSKIVGITIASSAIAMIPNAATSPSSFVRPASTPKPIITP